MCGTLADRAQFRLDQLGWIRRFSPVLQVIDAGVDGPAMSAEAFWEEVAKRFPATFSLCTVHCRDVGTFFQTMDDWSIDAPPGPFMDMIFGGRSKDREVRQKRLDEAVETAVSPEVAESRRTFRELHLRFAAMMDTWNDRLAEPSMLRAALACPAHPHVDAYVRAKLTKERLAAAARTYDLAFDEFSKTAPGIRPPTAAKLRLVMELMCDAYGTGRLNWLQWMDKEFEMGDEESLLLLSMASVHHYHPTNTACLEWLFAHSRCVERVRRGEPILWQRLAQTAVNLASDKALRLVDPFRWQRRTEFAAWNPLRRVILNRDVARVKLVLELGCPPDPKAQMYAIATGIPEMIEFCATNTPDPMENEMDPHDLFQGPWPGDDDVGFRRAVTKVHTGYAMMRKYGHFWGQLSAAFAFEACLGFEFQPEYQNTMAAPAVYYHGAPLDQYVDSKRTSFSAEDAKHKHSFAWLIAHGLPFSDRAEATLRRRAKNHNGYNSEDDSDDEEDSVDEEEDPLKAVEYMVALRNLIRKS